MKVAFVGGGTLGPVTPLLATLHALKKLYPSVDVVWIGTPTGPEGALIRKAGIEFHALPIVKWPRYPSLRWISFPFAWARVRQLADQLVKTLKPDAVVTAGGFTAVPVVFAAAHRGIPCLTHQLDVIPGMANKRIARKCASVTTSFEYARAPFGEWVNDERIATPVRFNPKHLPSRADAAKTFGLHATRPITLIVGGGTGAQALNDMVQRTRSRWLKFTQLIHVTGLGKGAATKTVEGYAVRPFLDADMLDAMAAADLIVTRAGIGALSEIAALKKAAIVVPIPDSHQEANARALEEQGACVVSHQDARGFDDEILTAAELLLKDADERKRMGEAANEFLPTDDGTELAKRVLRVTGIKT